MPNQDGFNQFNFEGNPFTELIGRGQTQPTQPAQPAPQDPSQMGEQQLQQAAGQAGNGKPIENQFTKGENPDRARPLMSSIQQLENYIRESTDRDEIRTARGIIAIITRLIAKGQESMMDE